MNAPYTVTDQTVIALCEEIARPRKALADRDGRIADLHARLAAADGRARP